MYYLLFFIIGSLRSYPKPGNGLPNPSCPEASSGFGVCAGENNCIYDLTSSGCLVFSLFRPVLTIPGASGSRGTSEPTGK